MLTIDIRKLNEHVIPCVLLGCSLQGSVTSQKPSDCLLPQACLCDAM